VQSPWLIHSCGVDRQVLTYDLKKERRTVIHSVREGAFVDMTQRLDSEQELVTASTQGDVLFWDCDEAGHVGMLQEFGNLNGLQTSPNGDYIAVCSEDCSVKVWSMATQQLVAVGVGHSHPVSRLCWSPDQKQLVSVDKGCCMCVWNFYGPDLEG